MNLLVVLLFEHFLYAYIWVQADNSTASLLAFFKIEKNSLYPSNLVGLHKFTCVNYFILYNLSAMIKKDFHSQKILIT